jgi:hypothetical protein
VQAAAEVPAGFGAVRAIRPDGETRVVIEGESGLLVRADVDWRFPL